MATRLVSVVIVWQPATCLCSLEFDRETLLVTAVRRTCKDHSPALAILSSQPFIGDSILGSQPFLDFARQRGAPSWLAHLSGRALAAAEGAVDRVAAAPARRIGGSPRPRTPRVDRELNRTQPEPVVLQWRPRAVRVRDDE